MKKGPQSSMSGLDYESRGEVSPRIRRRSSIYLRNRQGLRSTLRRAFNCSPRPSTRVIRFEFEHSDSRLRSWRYHDLPLMREGRSTRGSSSIQSSSVFRPK